MKSTCKGQGGRRKARKDGTKTAHDGSCPGKNGPVERDGKEVLVKPNARDIKMEAKRRRCRKKPEKKERKTTLPCACVHLLFVTNLNTSFSSLACGVCHDLEGRTSSREDRRRTESAFNNMCKSAPMRCIVVVVMAYIQRSFVTPPSGLSSSNAHVPLLVHDRLLQHRHSLSIVLPAPSTSFPHARGPGKPASHRPGSLGLARCSLLFFSFVVVSFCFFLLRLVDFLPNRNRALYCPRLFVFPPSTVSMSPLLHRRLLSPVFCLLSFFLLFRHRRRCGRRQNGAEQTKA